MRVPIRPEVGDGGKAPLMNSMTMCTSESAARETIVRGVGGGVLIVPAITSAVPVPQRVGGERGGVGFIFGEGFFFHL